MKPFPKEARRLCRLLNAPWPLVQHLKIVHATAVRLLDALDRRLPGLVIDGDAVLFGAAVHDLAKVLHPEELTGPGNLHEADGPDLLMRHGVPARLARFAGAHGQPVDLEDAIVAWADHVWRHSTDMDAVVAKKLAGATGRPAWEMLLIVGDVAGEVE